MEYRVMKGEIPVCETILDTSAEQPIDLDFSLPDYCPDIQKIFKCQIYPTITEQTISDQLDVEGEVLVKLLYLDSADPGKDISIYFNTPGGSVYAGLGIYDTMQFISSDISTICTGMAASMGAVLLVAGTKGKRFALKHSRVMIHQPMGGAQGQASDIEITAREIQKLKKELYTIIADHSGNSYERVEKDSDRDYWMTALEAKEYGMIDDVLVKSMK